MKIERQYKNNYTANSNEIKIKINWRCKCTEIALELQTADELKTQVHLKW